MRIVFANLLLAGITLAACSKDGPASEPWQGPAPASPQPSGTSGVVRAETVARGLSRPWGLAFLPDGRLLVSERPGNLRIVTMNGTVSEPLAGVPAVRAEGQGGMLDVAVDPDFATNNTIYFTFAEPAQGGSHTALAKATLGTGRIDNVQVIFRQRPTLECCGHYGSRIVFRRDGTIFVTTGERQQHRPMAQQLDAGLGKIMRINRDGTIPQDNPFVGRAGAQPEIWSYGHRNVQAAALDPATGELWTVEHGARGGDELNNPQPGRNYGWPVITYGIDYNGSRIGEGAVREGMEQPVYYWDPVIAPSGMAFYTGTAIPGWQGSILIGSLQGKGLVRLVMENGRVAREERHVQNLGARIRDVQQGPDGFVYLVTDSPDGEVIRVRPAN